MPLGEGPGRILDLEALVRKVADDRLRRWGSRLRQHDYEDLIAYLIGTAWELSGRYDAKKDKNPNFAAYTSHILSLRCADWFRQRFGDTRHGDRPVVLSLDAPASLRSQDGDSDGAETERGRLVDSLAAGAGDPAHDRTPDLIGVLERGSGDDARQVEAVGQPPAGRAARGARPAGKVKRKPAVTPTHKPRVETPICETCTRLFLAAFKRANKARPEADRVTEVELAKQARDRARAVKFAGEYLCPRCTTVPVPGGSFLFLEQVYPNRAARRQAAKR